MDSTVVAALVRSVSKTGGFGLEWDQARQLAARISEADAVQLYTQIRDESHRDEREWRDEFVELFPNCEPSLPPVESLPFDPDDLFEIIDLIAYPTIAEGYLETFEDFLEQAEAADLDLSDVFKDGQSLREYAAERGKRNILELLDEYGVP